MKLPLHEKILTLPALLERFGRPRRGKVVFTNGLGFEGWIPRLVKSSATKAAVIVASKNVKPRKSEEKGHGHGHGYDADADPHAWQSVANAKIYVANIRDALVAADLGELPRSRRHS